MDEKSKVIVACLGASITQAIGSFDWIKEVAVLTRSLGKTTGGFMLMGYISIAEAA